MAETTTSLRLWTIYDHPKDFPDCFVARLFEGEQPTEQVTLSTDLEMLRLFLAEKGLVCIPRDDDDDPAIVESWL